MPKVKSEKTGKTKEFAYTKEGKRAAKEYANKTGGAVLKPKKASTSKGKKK